MNEVSLLEHHPKAKHKLKHFLPVIARQTLKQAENRANLKKIPDMMWMQSRQNDFNLQNSTIFIPIGFIVR